MSIFCIPTPIIFRGLVTSHRAVTLVAAILDAVAVDARSSVPGQLSVSCSFSSIEVDVFEIEGMNVTRYVAKERETDIDAEICPAACYHCDTDGRNYKSRQQVLGGDRTWLRSRSSICFPSWAKAAIDLQRMVMRITRRAETESDILMTVVLTIRLICRSTGCWDGRGMGFELRLVGRQQR